MQEESAASAETIAPEKPKPVRRKRAATKPAAPKPKKKAKPAGEKKPRAKKPRKPKKDPRFEELTACPLCAGADRKPFCAHTGDPYLYTFDNALADHKVQWWFCHGCGLIYQSPRLSPEGMNAFYASGYRKEEPKEDILKGKLYDSSLVVDFIRNHWNPPKMSGKCLDVGSGEGTLVKTLAAVHAAGGPKWDAYGVEPNEIYSEFARHKMLVQVATELFTERSWRGIDFRLITAQHVIEHLHDFKGFLRTAKARLRPEGRLYIGTPAAELPWGEGWSRPTCTMLETYAATHLQLFTSRTLVRALNDCGFYVEFLDHYIRGTQCLARHAEDGERNELAGQDDQQLLVANVRRGHEMWMQYDADPQHRHPFVQAEQGILPPVSASKANGVGPGDIERIDAPVQPEVGVPEGSPASGA